MDRQGRAAGASWIHTSCELDWGQGSKQLFCDLFLPIIFGIISSAWHQQRSVSLILPCQQAAMELSMFRHDPQPHGLPELTMLNWARLHVDLVTKFHYFVLMCLIHRKRMPCGFALNLYCFWLCPLLIYISTFEIAHWPFVCFPNCTSSWLLLSNVRIVSLSFVHSS